MDEQKSFLANNIFDIDSALDRLEENLFTHSDEKSSAAAISIEKFEQAKVDNGKQQQHNKEEKKVVCKIEQKDFNLDRDKFGSVCVQQLDDEVDEKEINSSLLPTTTTLNDDETSRPYCGDESTTIKSETLNATTLTATSLSFDDKTTTTLASSDSTNSTDSDEEGEYIPPEITSNTTQDESLKPLISDESLNQCETIEIERDEEVLDDQPVTTDLTLTKTVELTENEPDPEEEVNNDVNEKNEEKIDEGHSEQKTFNVNELVENQPIEMVKNVVIFDEPREIEISQYNFESTMDDISDAELESLEQELEELVAAEQINQNVNVVVNHESEKVMVVEEQTPIIAEETPKNDEEGIEVETQNDVEKAVEQTQKEETENFVERMETTESEDKSPIVGVVDAEEKEQTEEVNQNNETVVEEENVLPENVDDPPSIQESSVSEAQEAVEPPTDPALSSSTDDESASIRNIPSQSNEDYSMNESNSTGSLTSAPDLGRVPPYWIPDSMTNQCMLCDVKFNPFRRRHHCRACGLLLCSNCCNEKFFLHYMNGDGRICKPCLEQLIKLQQQNQPNRPQRPNPANPMEYCSTVPPQQQVAPSPNQPLTVMVPTSVLKRGPRTSERKSVIFSDGIRPGSDQTTPISPRTSPEKSMKVNMPTIVEKTQSFIPDRENELPPMLLKENDYRSLDNNLQLLQRLRQEEMRFAINRNFIVTVKIVTLSCCTNKTVINFATSGLLAARQDEILILLELNDDMTKLPREVFLHLNEIYLKAERSGVIIKEYGYSQSSTSNFLGAFGGFVYIKPTFQCQQSLTLPENPYLIGLLVHKWEVPWMRLFPLRLILRLGALYRYYPTPLLSNINREPVYAEIGNTVMNLLVDFRNFAYTIDIIKGLAIHMESRKTVVQIPKNRYELVMRAINNSTDHLLSFGADFSKQADGHLVCIQNVDSKSSDSLTYSTQAIDIQGRERIITGASFIIISGALKASSGLKAKCSIVEDGLMIQISSTKMQNVRDCLKAMKNVEIACGPIEDEKKEAEEIVTIEWIADDLSFNSGVLSPIDSMPFDGKESIRMKIDFSSVALNNTKILRWSEVFVLEMDETSGNYNDDHLNFSKLSEPIARACGSALLPFIDLMAASQLKKIGIRVTLGENIKYLAGSNGEMLASTYMNALDNELIGVIHRQAANMGRTDVNLTLELFFYILNK